MSTRPPAGGAALLYTRRDCPLCYEMERLARRSSRRRGVPVLEVDVDGDAILQGRYGHRVPVLEIPGEPPLEGRATADGVDGAFRRYAARLRAAHR